MSFQFSPERNFRAISAGAVVRAVTGSGASFQGAGIRTRFAVLTSETSQLRNLPVTYPCRLFPSRDRQLRRAENGYLHPRLARRLSIVVTGNAFDNGFSNFCRSLTGWSFRSLHQFCQEPRSVFSILFRPAFARGFIHADEPKRRTIEYARISIGEIRNV